MITSLNMRGEGKKKRHVQRLLLGVGSDRGKDGGKGRKIKTHTKKVGLMSQEDGGPTGNKEKGGRMLGLEITTEITNSSKRRMELEHSKGQRRK